MYFVNLYNRLWAGEPYVGRSRLVDYLQTIHTPPFQREQ